MTKVTYLCDLIHRADPVFPATFEPLFNCRGQEKLYYLHCEGAYRSVIASSILKSRGFDKVVNVRGGYEELVETDLKRTEFVEQITEL